MFICLPILDMNVQEIINSCINRIGMNWVLALALMPPMIAGIGINFGQSLGIVCGLLGGMLSIEWGLTGWLGFAVAIAISRAICHALWHGLWRRLEQGQGQ